MIPRSYSSIFAFGHAAIRDLFRGDVFLEEKVDGSQLSWMIDDGELHVRSKGAQLYVDAPDKMFAKGVEVLKGLQEKLVPGWTYRGEYLRVPKHNALAYNRTPNAYIAIFDIDRGYQDYLSPQEKAAEAERVGLECVPLLKAGILGAEDLRAALETVSFLGGQKIEGVVAKPIAYNLYGEDKKVLMGKFVSEAYKEVHNSEWKVGNPTQGDVLELLGMEYRTPARWLKAVQHVREAGELQDAPQDIPKLMLATKEDVLKECEGAIRDRLFEWAWPHIQRKIVAGLPQWWKEELVKKQFETSG